MSLGSVSKSASRFEIIIISLQNVLINWHDLTVTKASVMKFCSDI